MCLAIFKPGKLIIPEETLRKGWISNSDGAGFAYTRGNKVVIEKGFLTVKDFLEKYAEAFKDNKKSPFLVHFRIRSQGERGAANTHPFPVAGGALIHNGTIQGTGSQYDKGKSDTALFVEQFAERLDYETVNSYKSEFDEALGYNKVILLYDDSRHVIINEKQGHWKDDVWYSNYSHSGSSSGWPPYYRGRDY